MTPKKANAQTNPELLEIIKEEYIYGKINDEGQKEFLSYDKVCKPHNFSPDAAKRQGKKENWPALREDYRTKTALKTVEKKSSVSAERIVQSDDKFEDAGELIRRVGVMKLKQVEKELKADKFVRSIDIVNAASAVKTGQEVVKTAQGEALGKLEVNSEQRYKHTIALIGTDEFKDHELGLLNAVNKKQSPSK